MSVESAGGTQYASAPALFRGAYLLGVAAVVLMLALFGQRFAELARVWSTDDNYSHGFLVPLVSACLAWQYVRRVGGPGEGNVPAGLVWLSGGCFFHLAAVVLWWPPIDCVALMAMLHGLAVLAGGREWARGFRFPILFLVFLFPLPAALTERLAVELQGIVTALATDVLSFFLPVHRDGSTILLPGSRVEVGEACSGLRQLIAFAALTLIVVHLSGRGRLFKELLLLAGPMVAIVANLLRVLLMACLLWNFGPRGISQTPILPGLGLTYHDAWGLLTMTAGLGLLVAVAWWLGKISSEDRGSRIEDGETTEVRQAWGGSSSILDPRSSILYPPSSILGKRLALACTVLTVTLACQSALWAHLHNGKLAEPPPMRQPLASVPVSLGEWSGQDIPPATLPPLSRRYFEEADDRLNRAYFLPTSTGKPLEARLWAVHYRDGRDRNHHPYVCYKVAGLTEDASAFREVPVLDGGPPLRRFGFTGRGRRGFVYYWHYTLEPANDQDLTPLQQFHQRLSRRLPSVTVELFTEADDARLDALALLVDQEMQRCLPPGARRGSDVLPIRYVGVGVNSSQ
jgi:exosortase